MPGSQVKVIWRHSQLDQPPGGGGVSAMRAQGAGGLAEKRQKEIQLSTPGSARQNLSGHRGPGCWACCPDKDGTGPGACPGHTPMSSVTSPGIGL